jgi:2,3-diaminopropionate biosynthesis protein SbnA
VIHESVLDCIGGTPIVALRRLFDEPGVEVLAKLELLNPGGSVKDRPARYIVEQGLREGTLTKNSHLVESTSGNFGIALAMVCRIHGLDLTVVVDPTITTTNLMLLREYGANVDVVRRTDDGCSFLEQRIRRVRELVSRTRHAVWINQYANHLNWMAHAESTGREVVADLEGPLDVLVAAVSTTGTIHGLARALRRTYPGLTVVAVDAVGSVIFGHPPGPRRVPGIGAGRVPELLCPEEIDRVVHVSDEQAIQGCHDLLRAEGILAGGSSGSVVAALRRVLPTLPRPARVLTLLPDRGERYLDLVYGIHPDDPASAAARDRHQPARAAPPGTREEEVPMAPPQDGRPGTGEAEFWRAELAAAPDLLAMPTDRTRRPGRDHARGQATVTLDDDTVARLRALTGEDGGFPQAAVLAGFAAVLSRWSGQSTVVLGAAGPNEPLIMRVELTGRPSFRALLDRVDRARTTAATHCGLPFAQLVRELGLLFDAGHHPVFQAALVPAGHRPTATGTGPAGVALDLVLRHPVSLGESAVLDYDASLFTAATAARLAGHLPRLLAAAAADPGRPVGTLPLLGSDEHDELARCSPRSRPLPARPGRGAGRAHPARDRGQPRRPEDHLRRPPRTR